MGKQSKAEKKKKGPKGKQARAKAKLERQWGEEAREGKSGSAKRVGRSRILSHKRKPVKKEEEEEENDEDFNKRFEAMVPKTSDDSDESDEEENEEDETSGGAYSKLLQTIRNTKQMKDEDSESEDEDMEEVNPEYDVENNESEDEGVSDDGLEEDASFDPFATRFSKAPLPEDESKREEIVRVSQQSQKLAVPHVHPLLELQAPKYLVEEMDLKSENDNTPSPTSWRKLSKSSFGCNRDVLKQSWQENRKNQLSSWQSVVYPFMTRYTDCLIPCQSSKKRNQMSELALLHIVNHVLTSREHIQRQSRRINAMTDEEKEENTAEKDQGFTRPTILVLLPTRGKCYTFLQKLLHLVKGGNVPDEYKERFENEYGPPPTDEESDEALRRRRKKVFEEKGSDWQDLFGDDANDDDDFKIGVALNARAAKKKDTKGSLDVSAKLYTDFYSSDIIVASPLALRMAISSDSNEGDSDFLSSIEICLLDRSDVMMMQNWDHVNDVLDHINQLPSSNNETDFSRVRDYFLVDQAAHWRQLIVLSDILDPSILSTFKRFAKSQSGVLKTRQKVSEDEGTIGNVLVPVRQVFQRTPAQKFATMSEDRMKYMTQKILPQILHNRQKHTLIYIPSYFDFVLLRNYLMKNEGDFVSVTEYSRVSETSRGRARFLQGRKPLMLYTGRAHFFLRHKIKGVRNLIFFGLPEHPEFYSDLVNVIGEGLEDDAVGESSGDATTSSMALFTKYEVQALERIVGTDQSNRMVKGEKAAFLFVS